MANGALDEEQVKEVTNVFNVTFIATEEKLPSGQKLSNLDGCIEEQSQCATPLSSTIFVQASESILTQEIIEPELSENWEDEKAESKAQDITPVNIDSFDEAVEHKHFVREDSVGALSTEGDDISITEATNDLLSIYQNEIHKTRRSIAAECLFVKSQVQEGEKRENGENVIPGDHETLKSENEDSRDDQFPQDSLNPPDLHLVKGDNDHLLNFKKDTVSIQVEDNQIEEDVRSLYPDVVVISSSDEDIHSRSSRASSPSITERGDNIIHGSDIAAGDIPSENLSDTFEKLADDFPTDQTGEETKTNSEELERANKQSSPGTVKSVTFGSLQLESDDTEDSKQVSETEPDKVASPLKNASFVLQLEKIIGAQSVKVKFSTHPSMRKSKSMVDMVDSSNSANTDSEEKGNSNLCASKSFDISGSIDGKEFAENQTEINKREHSWPGDAHNEGRRESEDVSQCPAGDIREKLERIFSTGISSTPTFLTSKSSYEPTKSENHSSKPEKTFIAKEMYESNLQRVVKDTTTEQLQQELNGTKKCMANVLGTLRLHNIPRQSSIPSSVLAPNQEQNSDNHLIQSLRTFPAKELYESNIQKGTNDLSSEELQQGMDETRKRMANVLGTLRLHNHPHPKCT